MSYTFLTWNYDLAENTVYDGRPCFSPDGNTILFMRTESGVTSFYTIPTTGGDATKLFSFPGEDQMQATRPDWSWVNNTIAFTGCPMDNGQKGYLYTIDSSGGSLTYYPVGSPAGDQIFYPSWYPDGKSIAITNYSDNLIEQVFVDPPSTDGIPVSDPDDILYGMCSINQNPDTGWLLAGAAQRPSQNGYHQKNNHIWLQTFSGEIRENKVTAVGRAPWWSPDGSQIAFEGTVDKSIGSYAIYVQTIGSPEQDFVAGPIQVTPSPPQFQTQHAKWSPTGSDQLVCMVKQLTPQGPFNGIVLIDF